MNLQILGYIFEAIAIVSALIAAYEALKRDPKHRTNQLMATSMVSMALYVIFIMLYDVIVYTSNNPNSIYIFFPQALVFIVTAVIFLYLSMKTITDSTQWLTIKRHWVPHIIIIIIFAIFINIVDFIKVVENSDSVDTQMDNLVLGVVIILIIFYLLKCMQKTYIHGIKRSEGMTRKKLVLFELGLFINFCAIFINIVAQITPNATTGQWFDIIFFMFIAIAAVIFSIGFLLPSSDERACIDCDDIK